MQGLSELERQQAQQMTRDEALKALESKNEHVRRMGMAALELQGDSGGEIILQRLHEEAAKRKRRKRIASWAMGIYGAFILLFLGIWFVAGVRTGHWGHFPFQAFQFFNFFSIFAGGAAASQFQKSATEFISRFDDVRYVPDLVNALQFNDKNMNDVARSALTNLLPRLTASDSEAVDTEQRKLLHRWLTPRNKDLTFSKSILKAFEQVGDERDLPVIKKLAEHESATSREKELKQAAQECLPYVEQRADLNRAANTLLRASASTTSGADSLLRPAKSNKDPDAESLLRATDQIQLSSARDQHSDETQTLQNLQT